MSKWETEEWNKCLSAAYSRLIVNFPYSSIGKNSACSAGDLGLIPGSGRSPGDGNGKPLQHSCMETPMDRGATVHGITRVEHNLVTNSPIAS